MPFKFAEGDLVTYPHADFGEYRRGDPLLITERVEDVIEGEDDEEDEVFYNYGVVPLDSDGAIAMWFEESELVAYVEVKHEPEDWS